MTNEKRKYVEEAFPGQIYHRDKIESWAGMSLREYYAGMAMQITFANFESTIEHDAELAFKMADAMIAERNKS